jgi:hypothetical protein
VKTWQNLSETPSRHSRKSRLLWLGLLLACFTGQALAQDLEPRRWSHLPTGLNVIGVASAYTPGETYFDPVLRLEDVTFDLYTTGLGYVRTFDLFGTSARIDFNAPYSSGRWEGLVDGEYASTRRRGFMDPRIRFSWNLYGAPALSGKEYVAYLQKNPVNTTIGAAVAIKLPLGDYNPTKLINLGDNRTVVRPQIGVLHTRNKWQFEVTGSVFLYQDNDEFWNGNKLEQDPLWFAQAHVIYAIKPGWWVSASAGFAYDGMLDLNGTPNPVTEKRQRYMALSFGMPITRTQGIKFAWLGNRTNNGFGSDYDAFIAAWSINWGL